MRKTTVLFFFLFYAGDLSAQKPQWQHTTLKDPLTEKTIERMELAGELLAQSATGTIPSALAAVLSTMASTNITNPKLVLLCSNGKLIKQYGIVSSSALGALPLPTVNGNRTIEAKIDFVVDGSKKKTVSAEVIRTTESALTGDDKKTTYLAIELKNLLPYILRGKSVTLVARDNYGNSMTSNIPPRQSIVEFQMADPTPVFAVCGEVKETK